MQTHSPKQTQLMVKPQVTHRFFFPLKPTIFPNQSLHAHNSSLKKGMRSTSGTSPFLWPALSPQEQEHKANQRSECIYSQTGILFSGSQCTCTSLHLSSAKPSRESTTREGQMCQNNPWPHFTPFLPLIQGTGMAIPKKHWWDWKENTQGRRSWWHLKQKIKIKKTEKKESRKGRREGSNWQRGMQCSRDKKTS